MGRMHTSGYSFIPIPLICFLFLCRKGISGSSIPYSRRAPTWLKTSADEAQELICKLAKKGLTPSQVGSILRDSHGIGQVKSLTGNKIVRILRANGTFLCGLLRVPSY